MKFPKDKCGLVLEHNVHRMTHTPISEWIQDNLEDSDWESIDAKRTSIDTDEVWTLYWHPDNTVGSFRVAAPTLDELLRYANED